LVFVWSACLAAAADREHVRVRLVADPATPRTPLRVGVLFEMDPGWHVYWKNPGDSGLATEVRLELPAGFDAGPLQWPLPVRFIQPGDLIAYGYEGAVLLAAELNTPSSMPEGSIELAASVSWLACKEKCVLGAAELRQTLREARANAKSVFERWQSALPVSAGAEQRPFGVSTTGGFEGDERSTELAVWLQWSRPPAAVEWFPESDERIEASDPRSRTRGNLTRVDVVLKRVGSSRDRVENLGSLVVATDKGGGRRGWELRVPITSNQPSSPTEGRGKGDES
jgi:DsbC/DsbD-like thiol-disulfide interchange protein